MTTLVNLISKDIFLYNVQNIPSGAIGFGYSSGLMVSQAQNNITPWLIEVGNVTDLTFAGSTAPNSAVSTVVVGPGDYSTLFTGNETNSVTLPSFNFYKDASQGFTFQLDSIFFG